MEKLKTTNVRDGIKRPYQSPTTSVLALDYLEGVLAVLSWNDGHREENFDVLERDPTGDGKKAKGFSVSFQDIWEDDEVNDEE